MRIDTYFTVPEVDGASLAESAVVVIDVVRATTTIIEALANGARAIFPTESTEEAVRLASSLGREDSLLCGERKGEKIEGFDLGNSPAEFTTGGGRGQEAGDEHHERNARAWRGSGSCARSPVCADEPDCSCHRIGGQPELIAIVCAGQEDGFFPRRRTLCAGHLIQRILEHREDEELELIDASRAVRALAQAREPTRRFLSLAAAGKAVIEIGLEDDLAICADVDRHDIVVEMHDQDHHPSWSVTRA